MSLNPDFCRAGTRAYICLNCKQTQIQYLQGAGTRRLARSQSKRKFCSTKCKKEYLIKKSGERRTKLPFEP